ncbi:hypothetical protein [Umezawaea sp. Da 62-37]|uniref:hypothetical protein n=1 Tax=Umezawaea sp. Da 62-37 TaxID=3075927 RepID=UPI0028F6E31E|nr:hypothetical protein [Umezawaea sp. Da 62-37]WNV85014.1 hypothetical protein RM788_43850 [Umezawaea sp. Da 62-37]
MKEVWKAAVNPVPNNLLSDARKRLPSPNQPNRALSRQELAEALNVYMLRRDLTAPSVDLRSIGKYERGVNRWPRPLVREAMRSVLKVETDEALGFHRGDRTPTTPVIGSEPAPLLSSHHAARFCMLPLQNELVLVIDRRRMR